MPDQVAGTLSFNRPKLSTTAPAAVTCEYRLSTTADNQVKIEQYASLDPSAVAQVSTIVVKPGAVGDLYSVTLSGDAPPTTGSSNATLEPQTYIYRQKEGDTAAIIAEGLAKAITDDPRVAAKASGGTITVTGAVSGLAFVLDNAGTTTVGNAVIATPTKAAGNVRHVKVQEIVINYGVNETGLPTLTAFVQWFTGDATSVPFQAPVKYAATGPKTFDAMQVANGIPRPA
jgi:hypothetical protein